MPKILSLEALKLEGEEAERKTMVLGHARGLQASKLSSLQAIKFLALFLL